MLHRVLRTLSRRSSFQLSLLLLQNGLEDIVAGDVVGVLLSAKKNVQFLRLLVQDLSLHSQRVLQSVQHIGQELRLGLRDEGPNLNAGEQIYF